MTYKQLCDDINQLHDSGDLEGLFAGVQRLAYKRTGDEDTAQDIALDVWAQLPTYKPERPFAAWVNGIISRHRADLFAARANDRTDELGDTVFSYQSAEQEKRVPSITFPSEKAKVAFNLKALGYSDSEIAHAAGMTVGSLRVQFTRWRKQITIAC